MNKPAGYAVLCASGELHELRVSNPKSAKVWDTEPFSFRRAKCAPHRIAPLVLAEDVAELVAAATEVVEGLDRWNEAMQGVIGRQPNTGFSSDRLRVAVARLGGKA